MARNGYPATVTGMSHCTSHNHKPHWTTKTITIARVVDLAPRTSKTSGRRARNANGHQDNGGNASTKNIACKRARKIVRDVEWVIPIGLYESVFVTRHFTQTSSKTSVP